jgi:dihydroorotate dehydrogenase electron transfer subunit
MSISRVHYNERIGPLYYKLGLFLEERTGRTWNRKSVVPGQFLMVKVSDGRDPLLRRPFSIYNILDPKGARVRGGHGPTIEILYKVAGRGTEIMSRWEPGHLVDILGPLGNGFPPLKARGKLLIVAGGVGIASFYLLTKRYAGSTLLFGVRGKNDVSLARDFKALGTRVRVATEDGSVGEKGLVTKLVGKEVRPDTVIFASGPTGMLKAVSQLARKNGIRCFVSMERAMACGIGVCLGCAVKTKREGYKMSCSDGPVFDCEEIEW